MGSACDFHVFKVPKMLYRDLNSQITSLWQIEFQKAFMRQRYQ